MILVLSPQPWPNGAAHTLVKPLSSAAGGGEVSSCKGLPISPGRGRLPPVDLHPPWPAGTRVLVVVDAERRAGFPLRFQAYNFFFLRRRVREFIQSRGRQHRLPSSLERSPGEPDKGGCSQEREYGVTW